ncbi:PucR family transcriptional regulator [Streptomyces daliensis]|uniref:Helix-turn-helix domain-containing protein n=1 Tax=Streptomyces daliensis TaxID=299421 RepID=A0A8T4IHZ4_9ACTN|nr:helix-turn-helix domain-containing protein [Streptomyces daliensis]
MSGALPPPGERARREENGAGRRSGRNGNSGNSGHLVVVPALAESLIEQLPQLIDQLMELIVDRQELVLEKDTEAEFRRSLRENVLAFLRMLAGMPPLGDDAVTAPEEWGHCRARKGVTVESLLHTHRLATQVLWQRLFDQARSGPPDTVQRLIDESGPVWEALDGYSHALIEGHRAARTGNPAWRTAERRNALLDRLIDGRGAEPSVAAEAQVVLGFPRQGRFVVIVAPRRPGLGPFPGLGSGPGSGSGSGSGHGPGQSQGPGAGERPAHPLGRAVPAGAVRAAWRVRADREIGVLELGRTPLRRLTDWLAAADTRRVGVSAEVGTLAEVATAHHYAETALQTLAAPGATGVAVFDDRLLEALVVTSPYVARRLAKHTFRRLLECDRQGRELLLDTLDAWFRSGRSASKAAHQLHCHRNTVLNRLRRVEELTGGSLDDERHQLACQMTLVALRTLPSGAGPSGVRGAQ